MVLEGLVGFERDSTFLGESLVKRGWLMKIAGRGIGLWVSSRNSQWPLFMWLFRDWKSGQRLRVRVLQDRGFQRLETAIEYDSVAGFQV